VRVQIDTGTGTGSAGKPVPIPKICWRFNFQLTTIAVTTAKITETDSMYLSLSAAAVSPLNYSDFSANDFLVRAGAHAMETR
jgi:hypothetical protein